ncbi:MAG: ribonuclease HII [Chloroflexi bacterium]|nr:ribonuclease HII [Chloroflexota bacterium]
MPNNILTPSFAEEKLLMRQGYRRIAGIDEAGRGSLAGPVVAAAVILPRHLKAPWLEQVRDSKLLTTATRESLFRPIARAALAVGIGIVSHEMIDKVNILNATRLAMKLAVNRLSPPADSLLIDYLLLPGVPLPQKGVTDGDSLCLSIACASIIAKVARDHIMIKLDKAYPGYKLSQHKGYCTEEHVACLQRLGPSPVHRKSFNPLREELQMELEGFDRIA